MKRLPSRRAVALLVVIGLALVTLFVVIVNFVGDANDRLRSTGVTETGIVVALTSGRTDERGSIDYQVGDHTLRGSVDLGSDASHYHVGDIVTVYYDRQHPTHMTIDGEDNQSSWSVMACALLLIVGMTMFGSGCVLGIRRMVRRRRLARVSA